MSEISFDDISLEGHTALVTGSTDGLGRAVAHRLGALGANVIVHGRSAERGDNVLREIQGQGSRAELILADLASLAEVQALADAVLERHNRLDILVNNAGIIPSGGERGLNGDGYEVSFAINYLSHFLLTRRLLPLLERSSPARIVNVASIGQAPIDFEDVMMTQDYSPLRAYSQSKLAQIMFTMTLAERLDPARVTVNSLHPATFMDTSMLKVLGRAPLNTVETGADAVMRLAVSPELEGRSGLYFDGLDEAEANAQAYDERARERLWELSVAMTADGPR